MFKFNLIIFLFSALPNPKIEKEKKTNMEINMTIFVKIVTLS